MGVRVIVGDYKVNSDNDIIVSTWNPDCVRKTKISSGKNIVLYAEFLGLTKSDFEFIAKNATADVIVVCETKKTMDKKVADLEDKEKELEKRISELEAERDSAKEKCRLK